MNIVMFSMTPLFADKSMGGAQKQLKKVALHLAQNGHQVTILCTRRSDAMEPFHWHDNLEIVPIYRFKQPFPEPYATPTFNIAAAIQDTGEYLARADVFYSHDGGLIFPYVYQDTPTVISLRSILFSETLQSGYLFQGDTLILPSDHTRSVWVNTVGRFFPEFKQRAHIIHNGLDFHVYKPTDSSAVAEQLGVDPSQHRIILYPHRPEEPKGIRQTIALADRLVNQHGMDELRVLVPQWIDTGLSASVREFYDDLERDIAERSLSDHFIFHEWISDSQMPAYLSLGDLTVALGNYVETFGNVPYESLACGTPVLAVRVGPYRDMLAGQIALVDYGDLDAATEAAVEVLNERADVPKATMQWLHENFQQADMVTAYADLILNARKLQSMPYQFKPIERGSTAFRLAPWCYKSGKRIWNDFIGAYSDDPALLAIVQSDTHALQEQIAAGRYPSVHEALMTWYRDGYLVPLQEQAK